MAVSAAATIALCISSACALLLIVALSIFVCMWCGCCHVSDDEFDEGRGRHRRRGNHEALLHGDAEGQVAVPERKGIPLNSKPPRLTPEQELLRDKALEKYKRRKAREERRRARQAAREARLANRREGAYDDDGLLGDDDYEDGQSSVTSRTTLTSAATTVRTASTAAYGRGAYLLPPPHACKLDMEEEDEGNEVRSVYSSSSSRHSSGTARSKASQGTIATIKSYIRHRQRQRLRRREEQQQIDLFNQWAEAQMASSSELSPSSKSSTDSSTAASEGHHSGRDGGRRGSHKFGGGHCGRGRRQHDNLDGSFHGGDRSFALGQPRPRSSSVASSAPRPPEEILGDDHIHYSFMDGAVGEARSLYREQAHLQAGYPTSLNTLHLQADNGAQVPEGSRVDGEEERGAAVRLSVNVSPPHLPSPPRRTKRTWKDVEHNVALSGFFNSPVNMSFGGLDARYNDGEAPAPFRKSPAERSHSPIDSPRNARLNGGA
ncbi:putative transcription like protein nupm1 [Leptomonas seymouri]|uniref:Putative transcription like protein nupm1 n=1 Tax=Leptomonas seymouri TaxID=5684 RepID=A0A0N1IGX0_LEPSE|nr:putative transcription like protein nupm1 [Leptomonas seymouri]|eukprot:KPI83311.1 putative transcription like protein nupm1 [Leptomonas seymouri]